MELNKETHVNSDQITASRPIVLQDSIIRKQKEKHPIGQTRDANLQRIQPHLLNLESRYQINIGGSTVRSHQVDDSGINLMQTSYQIHNHFGFSPRSFLNSRSTPENHGTGVVAREGQTTAYLYFPLLSASTPNRRAARHQLNHRISSFYPVAPVPRTSHSTRDFFGLQDAAQYECNQPARNVQPPLPSYRSSEILTNSTRNAGTSHSQSILGKRPAESFFRPPPLDAADDMAAVARGPQCSLQTSDLLSLVESVGTPVFLANSEMVLGSGSSLYEPRCAAAAAAPVLFPATSSNAVPEPSSLLGLKDGNGDENGKGTDVWSYWNCAAIARTMERMRMRETTTQKSLALPVKTLDLDGQGCSRNTMKQRRL
ncbi:hypothetical protein ABZP36_027011 [Zizania latifolia]